MRRRNEREGKERKPISPNGMHISGRMGWGNVYRGAKEKGTLRKVWGREERG